MVDEVVLDCVLAQRLTAAYGTRFRNFLAVLENVLDVIMVPISLLFLRFFLVLIIALLLVWTRG